MIAVWWLFLIAFQILQIGPIVLRAHRVCARGEQPHLSARICNFLARQKGWGVSWIQSLASITSSGSLGKYLAQQAREPLEVLGRHESWDRWTNTRRLLPHH